ncbi:FAD-binding oxidoreductase [Thermodesulfobacteriota bacterium]
MTRETMANNKEFIDYCRQENILFSENRDQQYRSDASFLTRGTPFALVFPKNESEVTKVVSYAAQHTLAITLRAMGSSTAGAALADEHSILMVVDRLGVCDDWGVRQRKPTIKIVDQDLQPAEIEDNDDRELYAVVGGGLSTDELDRYLKKMNYHIAVVPSSGWSSIGGNFATNAGGNGTPKYGTFKDIVGYLKMVVADDKGVRTIEIMDKNEIEIMSGFQGTLGVILEVGVLIVPILKPSETESVVLSYEADDIAEIGEKMGTLIEDTQKNCSFLNAEFLFIDPLLLGDDDVLWENKELADFLSVQEQSKKMLLLYQGEKKGMQNLEDIVKKYKGVTYKRISIENMKCMLEVRKAATGKSTARVALPGFEDIYVTQPSKLGIVLKKILELCDGKLPGRPIGHQYIDGIVVHYRPQALVTKEEYLNAWQLTQELTEEILNNEKYCTLKRKEHGLGLELFKLSDEQRKTELSRLKKKYDPNNIFNPHLFSNDPKINFIGEDLKI